MGSKISFSRKTLSTLLACAALFVCSTVSAQTVVGSGKVVDSKGEAIIGASVIEKGSTSNGVMTDIDGKFQLSVPARAQLEISCIGYVTVSIAPASNLQIVLEEDAEILEETVVIGYGSVKKSTLSAAVASMSATAIEDRPMARAEQALQGQLAGVSVRVTSSEPGTNPEIRVRGSASLSAGSEPLYVIDGIPQNNLAGINPNDIANIEVLKDAASAAIYGSRGSNGVVIVSTKSGKKGAPQVSFNASWGLATLETKMDVLSAVEWMEWSIKYRDKMYLAVYPQGKVSDSWETRVANTGWKATENWQYSFDNRWFNYVSEATRAAHTYTKDSGQLALLDWQEYMFKPALTQDYNISVAGATDRASYIFSLGYLDQNGLYPGSNYKRISTRANVNAKINEWISMGVNLTPTFLINRGAGRANGKDSQTQKALESTPIAEVEAGYLTGSYPYRWYNWARTAQPTPRDYNKEYAQTDRTIRLMGSTYLRATPVKGLQIELTASANYSNGSTHAFNNSTIVHETWLNYEEGARSSASYNTNWSLETLLQAVANYEVSWDKHNFSAMLGASSEVGNIGFSTSQGWNALANDEITGTFSGNATSTTNYVTGSSLSEKTNTKLLSTFSRLQYNYDSRYVLSASLRYDGYSRFGAKTKWGWFPSISGAWNVASEPFFQNMNLGWWNVLKLRASYGVTGNNGVGESAAYSTLSRTSFDDSIAYVAGSFGNSDLGWEKTHSTDVAVDMAFFNNRIQASIDWYTKTTTGLLYNVPVPSAFGKSSITDNLGTIWNGGLELELNTHNINNKDFSWSTSFNVSYNKNKVVQLGSDNAAVTSGQYGALNVLEVGMPMYYFKGYKRLGVWMSQKEIDDYKAANGKTPMFSGQPVKPGDLKFEDITGDGNITSADYQYLGKPTPDFMFGMTNSFRWKNFDASILFTAQLGAQIFGYVGRALDRAKGVSNNAWNMYGRARDCWWSEDEPGNGFSPYPLSTVKPDGHSGYCQSSNYFRIKNLTLGYKIPFKRFAKSARVFVSCENLLILDNYTYGYSPEASNGNARGADFAGYPSARTFTAGFNLNF